MPAKKCATKLKLHYLHFFPLNYESTFILGMHSFPSPLHEVKSESEVAQSCPTLSDPMDCSPPGSSANGIFQALS